MTYRVDDGVDTEDQTFSVTVVAAPVALTLPDPPDLNLQVGVEHSSILPAASGGTGNYGYAVLSIHASTGLSFNTGTRELSGTPTAVLASDSMTYRVDDGVDTEDQTFTVEVVPALTLPDPPDLNLQVGVEHSSILPAASGGTGNYGYAVLSIHASTGLSFNTGTRELSGTPTAVLASDSMTYRVDDGVDTEDQTFTVEVVPALTLPDPPDLNLQVGVEHSSILPAASGGTGNYGYAVLSIHASTGLSFNTGTRVLSGTPTAVLASDSMTYRVDDGVDTEDQTFSVTVVAAPVALTLPDPPDLNLQVGVEHSSILPAASGGTGNYGYAVLSIHASTGLSFNTGTRVLSGTPTAVLASDSMTYRVDDGVDTEDQTFSVTVVAAPVALTLPDPPDLNLQVGVEHSSILPAASGGTGNYGYAVLSIHASTGLSFNTGTRVLSGTPTAVLASDSMTYRVDDGVDTEDQTFSVTVVAAPVALTLPDPPDLNLQVGVEHSSILPAASGGTGNYGYAVLSIHASTGLSFNTGTRVLSGTPTAVLASDSMTYRVDDGVDTEDQTFSVTVVAAPVALTLPDPPDLNLQVGVEHSSILPAASGGTGNYGYAVLSIHASTGLSFNTGTRVLSGTPTAVLASDSMTYRVDDGVDTEDQTFSVTVVAAPVALTLPDPPDLNLQVGVEHSSILPAASGGTGNYGYAVLSIHASTGLSFNTGTRVLSGTPTAVLASDSMTYRVDDGVDTEDQTFSVTVVAAPVALTLPDPPDLNLQVGVEHSSILPGASGGTGNYVYSVLSIHASTGLSFNTGTRELSGTPTAVLASDSMTYRVDDGVDTEDQTFTVEVVPALTLPDPPDLNLQVGVEHSSILPAASGGTGNYVYSVLSIHASTGLSFNTGTRVLSGTPTAVLASDSMTYRVNDGVDTEDQTFSVTVVAAPVALTLPDPPNLNLQVGVPAFKRSACEHQAGPGTTCIQC